MKSPESDEMLARALADWRVVPRRDAAFRAAVWARIEVARRAPSWTGYARAHAALLTGAMAAAVVLGGWVGREQARSRVAADRAEIANAYVQSLDARAMRMP
jgi:hypothetical protein